MKRLFLLILLFSAPVLSLTAQDKIPVIIDNDFCGDPDGLFQLAHHALCSSTDIRGIIGSHINKDGGFTRAADQAEESCRKALEVLSGLGMENDFKVVKGASSAMTDPAVPIDSEGARLIVEEARRCSPERPLYVCCGASLTDIASACLLDKEIEKNIVLVWIGGQEYPFGTMPPEGMSEVEYNLALSIPAGMMIFNDSEVRIWQVPRDAYRQCIYPLSRLRLLFPGDGDNFAGRLTSSVETLVSALGFISPISDAYVLGDSPLVLLTALQTFFEHDTASCSWEEYPCPGISEDGLYDFGMGGRYIRVYTRLDTALMFSDMESQFQLALGR